jgi:hypothetical protein
MEALRSSGGVVGRDRGPWEGLLDGRRRLGEREVRRDAALSGRGVSEWRRGVLSSFECARDSWLRDCVRPESSSFIAFVDFRRSGRADVGDGCDIGAGPRSGSWDKPKIGIASDKGYNPYEIQELAKQKMSAYCCGRATKGRRGGSVKKHIIALPDP